MERNINYKKARNILLENTAPVGTERVPLESSGGRFLARNLLAWADFPAFDRSPYDGYALRAEDTAFASRENPVSLRIVEEIPAGSVPTEEIITGTAAKILTGAPIPKGATAVVMHEKTRFTSETVTIFDPLKAGDNIVQIGEDVKKGQLLAAQGMCIDAGLAGTLAGQGISRPEVYRVPKVGVISTGNEVLEIEPQRNEEYQPRTQPLGKIRNTNRYSISAALQKDGCETIYLGLAGDDAEEIAHAIQKGLEEAACDMIVLTGGVSVGDYDLTPVAMERAGCTILFRGVDIKPGMACCYGLWNGKLVCGLSGNPSSSLVNYWTVLAPAVRKLTGNCNYNPEEITLLLGEDFSKKSKGTRMLKGTLSVEGGRTVIHLPSGQGNTMISSSVGCNLLAEVPAGSGALKKGTELKGFLL